VVSLPYALHPADELATHAFEPCLLRELADHGFGQQLTGLDASSRY
jgi:hypothetical protein